MKRNLHRVLSIRALFESLSMLHLKKETGELRALEAAADRERSLALSMRGLALHGLDKGTESDAWLTDMTDADLLSRRRGRLQELAGRQRPAVDAAREDLLIRRRELRQAEIMLDAAAAAEEKDQVRREQKQADEWYQSRLARKKGDAAAARLRML